MALGRWGEAEHLMLRIALRKPQRWEPLYNPGVIRSITGDRLGTGPARGDATCPALAGTAFMLEGGVPRAIVTFASNSSRYYATILFDPEPCDARGATSPFTECRI